VRKYTYTGVRGVNPLAGAKIKYHNQKTDVDGYTFDSKAEANRYCDLKLLQKAKRICDLELQPRFDLTVNSVKIGFYKADFAYTEVENGERIVEDVKGVMTPVYRLKKKLVKALHGIEIREITG